jgi:hypothetical protein
MSKTIRVRVPIWVLPGDGDLCYGQAYCHCTVGQDGTGRDSASYVGTDLFPHAKMYYLTAELPIPESGEVAAEVERDEQD